MNRSLLFGISVAVATFVAGGTAVNCLCGRGPSDSRLGDAAGLVERRELIGLDRSELEGRLGRPTKDRGVSREVADETYWLGYDGACVDSRWLAVKFDAAGRVNRAMIVTD